MKEYVSEPEEVIIDELADLDIAEKDIEPEPIDIQEEHDHVVFKDLFEQEPEPNYKKYEYWKKAKTKKVEFDFMFNNNNNNLKRSIIMKEILDKPRAIKRTIR